MGSFCSSGGHDDNATPTLKRTLAQKKYGKYVATLPPGYREATLEALKIAESRKGRPVHMAEIYSVFEETS